MSDLVERLRRAFDADSVAEKNLAIRAAYDFIAAMQTDAAPALKPAVEVWTQALSAFHLGRFGHDDEAAAAVIEADRAAIIAAKDAEIAALQAHADALAGALEQIATVDMGGGFLGAQACRKVAHQALRAYEEFRR